MTKIIYIRQKPTKVAQYFGLDKFTNNESGKETDGVSVHPGARQSYGARLESFQPNVRITGLDENSTRIRNIKDAAKKAEEQKRVKAEREYLESMLNVDLSPHSEFWDSYRLNLVDRHSPEKKLDLDEPADKLTYTVAVANRLLAPDFDDLYDPAYEGAFLYVYNPEEQMSRRMQEQELRDKAAGLISQHGRNKDKLFYWCSALGKGVNKQMSRDDLYKLLTSHRESLKRIEDVEKFVEILDWDNDKLTISHLVKLAIRKKKFVKELGVYSLNGRELGKTESELIETLRLSENSDLVEDLEEFVQNLTA